MEDKSASLQAAAAAVDAVAWADNAARPFRSVWLLLPFSHFSSWLHLLFSRGLSLAASADQLTMTDI